MRVVIAPDKFAGSLSADDAATAIAEGWRQVRPHDDMELCPVADGGPGFVAALHHALHGEIRRQVVSGPGRERFETTADLLTLPDSHGTTVFIESAQACGLHLSGRRQPTRSTTIGVGELIAGAVRAGATRVVVGLGGSGTTDGGAGALLALGARAWTADGADSSASLGRGGAALSQPVALDLGGVRRALSGVSLEVATDVDCPLLGPSGAALGFSPQKGATHEQAEELERGLSHWAELCTNAGAEAAVVDAPGAGAAGGLGYGLMVAGGRRVSGLDLVLAAVDLTSRLRPGDVVITGEGRFDWQSLHGKVVSGVTQKAVDAGASVVVIAGQVIADEAAWRGLGVSAVHSLSDQAGSVESAMVGAREHLRAAAAAAAGTYASD